MFYGGAMRSVGLHIRYERDFKSVIDQALFLNTDIFQSFFVNAKGTYISPTADLVNHYRTLRDRFKALYVHSSYLINIADPILEKHPLLIKELNRARQLNFSHIIIHPGAQTKAITRQQAIDTVVHRLNALTQEYTDISFILENCAHGKRALGGQIEDLAAIRERLNYPEKVNFCIDTAHAHVFGYTIAQDPDTWIRNTFEVLGEALILVHLNDTKELAGSHNDKHCFIGEGLLGEGVLKKCVQHPLLQNIPLILELPPIDEQKQKKALLLVQSWMKEKENRNEHSY